MSSTDFASETSILFQEAPDPIVRYTFVNSEPIILAVNPAFESLFGYGADDVVGQSFDETLVPKTARSNITTLNDRIRSNEQVEDVVTRKTADGVRYFRLRNVRIPNADPPEWFAIYTDLTPKKEREKRLEQYEMLVEAIGDPMYVLDADGKIQTVNRAMTAAIGWSESELIGAFPERFMPEESIKTAAAAITEILKSDEKEWKTVELSVTHADGHTLICEDNLAVITDTGGNFAGSVGVIRDISDRKAYEKTLTALQQTTRELLTASSIDETLDIATTAAWDVLDAPFSTILIHDDEADVLRPTLLTDELNELYETTAERLTFAVGEGLTGSAFESQTPERYSDIQTEPEMAREDPEVRTLLLYPLGEHGVFLFGSPVVDGFDPVDEHFAEILSTTTKAALDTAVNHEELLSRENALERQNERLEAFASVVSHDLRNPLNIAQGYLDLVEMETDPQKQQQFVTQTQEALDRIERLVESLLTIAREGKQIEDPVPLALESIAQAAKETVGVPSERFTTETLPAIEGDPSRVQQLFENLLSNAVTHGGETVTVTVGTLRETDRSGFYVADDGPGIDESLIDSVFEWGVTSERSGTGLGLAIVSDIVEAHGWNVVVTNDDGARFEFWF